MGSDGSHSVTRDLVCDGQLKCHVALQHIIDVKYEVYGQAKKLSFTNQAYPTLKIMNHVAMEYTGKPNDKGQTPVTLRVLIDEETYERVKDATFKDPYYIPTHAEQIGHKLVESITIWMNAKAHLVGEKRVEGSEKLTSLKLSTYLSAEVMKKVEGDDEPDRRRLVFLVGDAAFGVPFFRSLNNGLLCGTHLAASIANYIKSGEEGAALRKGLFQKNAIPPSHSPNGYSEYVKKLAKREISTANNKKVALAMVTIHSLQL